MASIEVLRTWGGPDDGFELGAIRGTDGAFEAEVTAGSTTGATGTAAAAVLSQRQGSPALTLTLLVEIPSGLTKLGSQGVDVAASLRELADDVALRRSGTVACALLTERIAPAMQVTARLYDDGFTRHGLNAIVAECMKARRQLEVGFGRVAALHAAEAEYAQAMRDLEATQEPAPTQPGSAKPPPRPARQARTEPNPRRLKTAAEIASGSGEAPAKAATPPVTRMCPNPACGKPAAPDKRFCTACGHRIP